MVDGNEKGKRQKTNEILRSKKRCHKLSLDVVLFSALEIAKLGSTQYKKTNEKLWQRN
jgi:hypothetical protein